MNDDPQDPSHPGDDSKGLAPGERRLRAVDGDTYAGWDEIYTDNVVRLYRLIYSKVGNRPDAEDLTTEVFLTAMGPLRTTATRPEVRAYLVATARTVVAGFWRRRLGREVTTVDLVADLQYLNEPPSESDAPVRAQRLLAALPDRYRRVLELRFLEARSIKETANEMGVSVANAKILQHRALRMAAAGAEQ
ncbi:MAG TPA: RNA polymerase sigma factor [Acidimicrobiales bacterium]|nr:RNA polymerase sigma factor [Acidimicrobiales bacterium]